MFLPGIGYKNPFSILGILDKQCYEKMTHILTARLSRPTCSAATGFGSFSHQPTHQLIPQQDYQKNKIRSESDRQDWKEIQTT